ncbi:MAG: hypothetical protein AAGB10_05430 [Pseudomonadota bacterium]
MKTAVMFLALGTLTACQTTTQTAGSPTSTAPAVSQAGAAMPAGLTSDEQLIWNTLTPTAQAQAADHVANGGSFADFIAG